MDLSVLTSFWKNRKHNLDRMTFKDLVRAYFTHYAIWAYISLALVSLVLSVRWWHSPVRMVAAAAVSSLIIYPLGWYLVHRFILHGRFLYKLPFTAATWKRVHFDHHQDPNDLRVLFGALHTTLPPLLIVMGGAGWLINGQAGAVMALSSGLMVTCFYEFCHCVQHLNYTPDSAFLKEIKRLHLAHHFHSEQGNYGITNYFWDRLFGTFYAKAGDRPKSATVFNLGYTAEEAQRFPWVARLSGGTRGDGHPRRFWQSELPKQQDAA